MPSCRCSLCQLASTHIANVPLTCSKSTSDTTYLFVVDRPNPLTLTGALVGGPDVDDVFTDKRSEFHFTEVALDYNTGLTMAAAHLASAPAAYWDLDCSTILPNYPFAAAAANQPARRR